MDIGEENKKLTLELIHELGMMSIQEIRDTQRETNAYLKQANAPDIAKKYYNAVCEAVIRKKREKRSH